MHYESLVLDRFAQIDFRLIQNVCLKYRLVIVLAEYFILVFFSKRILFPQFMFCINRVSTRVLVLNFGLNVCLSLI